MRQSVRLSKSADMEVLEPSYVFADPTDPCQASKVGNLNTMTIARRIVPCRTNP